MKNNLVMPRRLAIQILHEAQIAQPRAIAGWVGAQQGEAASYCREQPASIWARLWSVPLAPAVPRADELKTGGLHLVISLNTKGVLEMRAWELEAGVPSERVLTIKD